VTGQLVRFASLLLFLVLGLHLARTRQPAARRRATNLLLGYVLVVSAIAGFAQWDNWPFSSYHILVSRANLATLVRTTEFWAVDAMGREWRIDPYAWSPLVELKLSLWFQQHFAALQPEEKQRVLRFLLERAEASRERLAAGRPIGYQRRLGVTLSAPHWWLQPRPAATAPTSYTGLRVYQARWVPRELLAREGSVTRTLLVDYQR
jgi:hypothetical protein